MKAFASAVVFSEKTARVSPGLKGSRRRNVNDVTLWKDAFCPRVMSQLLFQKSTPAFQFSLGCAQRSTLTRQWTVCVHVEELPLPKGVCTFSPWPKCSILTSVSVFQLVFPPPPPLLISVKDCPSMEWPSLSYLCERKPLSVLLINQLWQQIKYITLKPEDFFLQWEIIFHWLESSAEFNSLLADGQRQIAWRSAQKSTASACLSWRHD